jgi:hypothetical protein
MCESWNPEGMGSLWLTSFGDVEWNNFGWWSSWLRRRPVLQLNYVLAFALQLRKSKENLSQGCREGRKYSLCGLSCLLRDSLGWPAEHRFTSVSLGWLQSALCRHKCLPSCRNKGFTASVNFESKLSVSALKWLAKNRISRSSVISLLLTSGCLSRNEKQRGSQHLQVLAAAASVTLSDWTSIFWQNTDKLRAALHTLSVGQSSSIVMERLKHAQWLNCVSSHLVGVFSPGQLCIMSYPKTQFCFGSLYWPSEKPEWSGLLYASRSLKEHSGVFWDVGGNLPSPYPVLKSIVKVSG